MQREIMDPTERADYIDDMQRYLATKMYIVPYTASPSVYAFQPWMRYRDHDSIHMKALYGIGQEFIPGLWVDTARKQVSQFDPFGSDTVETASDLLALIPWATSISRYVNRGWQTYDGSPGSVDFQIGAGTIIRVND